MKTWSNYFKTACCISALVTVAHALVLSCEEGKSCRHVIRPVGNDLPHTPESGVYCACSEGECPKDGRVSDKSLSWYIDVGVGRELIVEMSFCTPIVPIKFCRRGQVAVEARGYSPFELSVSAVNCRCRRRRVSFRQKALAQDLQTGQYFYHFTCYLPPCPAENPTEHVCGRVYYNHEKSRLRTINLCKCASGHHCPPEMRLPDMTSTKDDRGAYYEPVNCAIIVEDPST